MGLGIKTLFRQALEHANLYRFPAIRKRLRGDTTQYGEFPTLWRLCGECNNGYVVEVGANDGVFCSNSYPFIQRGWRAALVEPNPAMQEKLQLLYGRNDKVKSFGVACGAEDGSSRLFLGRNGEDGYATLSTEDSWWYKETRSEESVPVTVTRLDSILDSAGCPQIFELLSIDTEGFDYDVLQGLDFRRFRPKVIITEDEKPPFTNKEKKEKVLFANGYKFVRRFASNAIWIKL